MLIVSKLFKIAQLVRKKYWKTLKIKTFGVRVMMVKKDKVFLVKHRYNDLWVFPGGQIEKDEHVLNAGSREVSEETPYIIDGFSFCLGTYKNTNNGKDDNVTVLVSYKFKEKTKEKIKDVILRFIEIKDSRWFNLNHLPPGISDATKRRIEEHLKDSNRQYFGDW